MWVAKMVSESVQCSTRGTSYRFEVKVIVRLHDVGQVHLTFRAGISRRKDVNHDTSCAGRCSANLEQTLASFFSIIAVLGGMPSICQYAP